MFQGLVLTVDSAARRIGYGIHDQLESAVRHGGISKSGERRSVWRGKHPVRGASPTTFGQGPGRSAGRVGLGCGGWETQISHNS
jgi:hypothetical protein